jgi:acyl dehydratase
MSGFEVGTQLRDLVRTLTLVDLVAYAGSTWDWNRLHYDGAEVAERGLPGPVVDGQMFGALLAEQVQDDAGPRCRIRRMGFRYNAMVFAGETVTVHGEVESVGDDGVIRVAQRITTDAVGNGGEAKTAVKGAWCEFEVLG